MVVVVLVVSWDELSAYCGCSVGFIVVVRWCCGGVVFHLCSNCVVETRMSAGLSELGGEFTRENS